MSSQLVVYSVPFPRLKAVRGSRADDLRKTILERNADWIAQFDTKTRDNVAEELEGYPAFLGIATALSQIFSGEPLRADLGKVYAHAYEMICATLSTELFGEWSPIARSESFFERLDAWLNSCGAGITLLALTCRGPLIDVPQADDFPSLGYWTPDEIGQAAKKLNVALHSWWPWSRRPPPDELRTDVADICRWIDEARRHPENGLVGVHHY